MKFEVYYEDLSLDRKLIIRQFITESEAIEFKNSLIAENEYNGRNYLNILLTHIEA